MRVSDDAKIAETRTTFQALLFFFFLVCVFPLCLCCVAGAKRLHAHIYKGVIISLSGIAFTIRIMTSSSMCIVMFH